MRFVQRTVPVCALAAITATLLLASGSVKADTYSIAPYDSPTFTDSLGSYAFSYFGLNNISFTLNPVGTTTLDLVEPGSSAFNGGARNSAPPQVFTGTASSLFTLNGVSHLLSDAYTLDGTVATADPPTLLGGSSVLYDLGAQGSYLVTPIASFEDRTLTITALTPAAPAVPEPGTVALLVGMGVTSAGFLSRHRKVLRNAA